MTKPIRVLCVDDNSLVAEALEMRLSTTQGYEWAGSLPDASNLLQEISSKKPDVVLLDIDLPGRSPFDVLEEITKTFDDVRVVMFSGLVRADLVNKAIDAGAWGYVSKSAGFDDLLAALDQVANGGFALGGDVPVGAIAHDPNDVQKPLRDGGH